MIEVRVATLGDLPELVSIYNHYVVTTHYTFDIEAYTPATRRPWLDQFDGKRYSCFIATEAGQIQGYASSAPFKPKAAYGTSAEVSIYLAPRAVGNGIGKQLYAHLFEALAGQDLHRAYALIALPNPASIALHERFGFTQAAHLREVGRKFDRYWDVAYFEKAL